MKGEIKVIRFRERIACCGNCYNWDGSHCTKDWNNLDPSYRKPDDDRDPDEFCDDHEWLEG